VSQAQSAAKLRARQESDLQLQVAEVARRRRDFEKLYDLVSAYLCVQVSDRRFTGCHQFQWLYVMPQTAL
jgi:hypothetical protein